MKQYQNISITLIIAAILVGVLSFVMPKNNEKYLGDRFWAKKTFAPSDYDIVLMGDSRVYRGLSPNVMEVELPGKKVFNVGFSNGGLNPTMFKMAENKLAKNRNPKVIVLGVSPNCITSYTQQNEQYLQEKNRPREDVFERLYLNGILYRFSSTTPEAIKEKLRKEPTTSFYLNEYHLNGYVESEKFPVDTMEAIPSYVDDFTNFKVEERYVNSLMEQVKEWSSREIIVVGFRPPVSQPMHELEDTLGLYNEAELAARFQTSGGHWINFDHARYKTYDGSHLNKESAVKLSRDLAKEIGLLIKGKK